MQTTDTAITHATTVAELIKLEGKVRNPQLSIGLLLLDKKSGVLHVSSGDGLRDYHTIPWIDFMENRDEAAALAVISALRQTLKIQLQVTVCYQNWKKTLLEAAQQVIDDWKLGFELERVAYLGFLDLGENHCQLMLGVKSCTTDNSVDQEGLEWRNMDPALDMRIKWGDPDMEECQDYWIRQYGVDTIRKQIESAK